MMRYKHLAISAVVVAMLASGTVSASAETVRRDDPVRDAPAHIDVTRAVYTHSQSRVRVVARIPELGRSGTAALSISRFDIFEAGYVLQIKKRVGERPRTRLYFFNHFDLVPRRCADVTGVWRTHQVRLSVARSCLSDHARERVFAQFGIQRGDQVDRAPAVRRLHRS